MVPGDVNYRPVKFARPRDRLLRARHIARKNHGISAGARRREAALAQMQVGENMEPQARVVPDNRPDQFYAVAGSADRTGTLCDHVRLRPHLCMRALRARILWVQPFRLGAQGPVRGRACVNLGGIE